MHPNGHRLREKLFSLVKKKYCDNAVFYLAAMLKHNGSLQSISYSSLIIENRRENRSAFLKHRGEVNKTSNFKSVMKIHQVFDNYNMPAQ